MPNVSTGSTRLGSSRTLLIVLVVLALALTGYLVYNQAHHSTDNFSISNNQTKLYQPLKSPN